MANLFQLAPPVSVTKVYLLKSMWDGWNATSSKLLLQFSNYCKTLHFRRILISQFPDIENSLHVNLVDFPINFIKRFASCFFWYLYQILLSKFLSYYCSHYILQRILHIISRKCWYSMQTNLWWWAIPKTRVHLFCDSAQIAKILHSWNIHVIQWLLTLSHSNEHAGNCLSCVCLAEYVSSYDPHVDRVAAV